MFYKIRLTIDEIDEINKGLKFIHRQRKEQYKHMLKNRDDKVVKTRKRKDNKLLIIDDENKLKMSIIENNI